MNKNAKLIDIKHANGITHVAELVQINILGLRINLLENFAVLVF